MVIFGHAGDGNLHPNILFDKRDPEQWATVQEMAAAIFALALELGGTLSGEHGIGLLKKAYLEEALGEVSVDVQKVDQGRAGPGGDTESGEGVVGGGKSKSNYIERAFQTKHISEEKEVAYDSYLLSIQYFYLSAHFRDEGEKAEDWT